MKLDEALGEKYRIQALLSGSAKDMHDYFERSLDSLLNSRAEGSENDLHQNRLL